MADTAEVKKLKQRVKQLTAENKEQYERAEKAEQAARDMLVELEAAQKSAKTPAPAERDCVWWGVFNAALQGLIPLEKMHPPGSAVQKELCNRAMEYADTALEVRQ